MPGTLVVVVEDHELVNLAVVSLLEDAGFPVVSLADADHVLKSVPSDTRAVLVADVLLPGRRDGVWLAEAWEREGPLRRAVLITGAPDLVQTHLPVLMKPLGLSRLVTTVQALFDTMPDDPAPDPD